MAHAYAIPFASLAHLSRGLGGLGLRVSGLVDILFGDTMVLNI